MNAAEFQLGSIWFWLTWRLATILVLFAAPTIAIADPQFSGPVSYICVGIIYAVMIVSNEELAYGHAEKDGIYYRRYFRRRFSSWTEISSIRWTRRNQIDFYLRRGFLFRRRLSMQSFGGKLSPELFSELPELVRWLLLAKPEGSEGILLKGPGL
jgi:hypothetical protein